ncbi:MAG: hypothetical protein SGI92_10390 [Bryobacteraceae bacterium]|nr:hypothetical protein [Bryobacteraceae bacterium]
MSFAVAILLGCSTAVAVAQQVGPGPVISAGYAPPAPIAVAPGQVITLFSRASASSQLTDAAIAEQTPLPTSLGGFSVFLEQTFSETLIPLPLFAVFPLRNCYGLVPSVCTPLTAITVQIPWQLRPNVPRSARPENFAVLRLSQAGVSGESVPLNPVADAIHVVSTCDTTMPAVSSRPPESTGACRPLLTHLDGELVTPGNPARAGETVVLYLVGLGATSLGQENGMAAAGPAALEGIRAAFRFGADLDPQEPGTSNLTPSYAGPTPGQVGLYQISFAVPEPPGGTLPCPSASSSNITVSFGRAVSFGGVAFCVEIQ